MKLTIISMMVFLTLPIANSSRVLVQLPQEPPSDIEKLEAEFKQLDLEDGVTVDVSGDKEASGNISIKVETLEFATSRAKARAADTGFKISIKKRLEIDLSKIDIPDAYISEKIRAAFLKTGPTGTLPGVKVMQIDASDIYEVVEDYSYTTDNRITITVRKGFRYDRASVPKPFWFIDRDSLSNVPALFHDLLYRNGGVLESDQITPYKKFSRKDTDDLFLELMTKCGVKPWRRNLAYQAVRNFSGFAWKEK